jgi:hypothetical protein
MEASPSNVISLQLRQRKKGNMSNFKYSLAFGISVLLFGCGGSSDITNPTSSIQNTSISEYTVTGSSATKNGVIPINSGVNNGAFKVTWNVSSSDPYHIELYLSNDSALSKSTDVNFFGQNCGGISAIYNCSSNGSFDCKFTSQNKISCGTITSFNKEKDISSFLDQIPKQAFLIIEACNGLFDSCKTSSEEIELQ